MDDQRTDQEGIEQETLRSTGSTIAELIVAAGVLVLVVAIPLGLSFGADFFGAIGIGQLFSPSS
jgi:hypothetical protein